MANIPRSAITKLSYLKEFVVPKVRKSIDGFSFNPEGYEKAKSILGKVSGNQPQKRQLLETLRKLNKVYGNVALTIDKLPGICEDLDSNDDDWQGWDFLQLRDALRSCTRLNPVEVVCPVVVDKAGRIVCRALLDSGESKCY